MERQTHLAKFRRSLSRWSVALFPSDPLTNRESLHPLPSWENIDGKTARNTTASLKFSEISAFPIGRSELVILDAKWQFCSLIEKEICLGCTNVKYAQRAEFQR